MKFWGTFRFELAYQGRRVWPWLIFVALLAFSFLMTRDGTLAEALHDDFFVNSPFAVAKTTVAGGLIWLLLGAVVAGDAAARDVETRMHPLTYTTSVGKAEYLGGRFLAALVLNASLLLAVQAGILLGIYWPGVDPESMGPFRPAAFLTAYAYLALPNAFFATAIQFALAARTGRAMTAYLGSLLLFFTGFFVAGLVLFRRHLGALLDPIGVRFVLDDLSHLWTTTEKSWRLLELEGTVLENRLVWLGIALLALAGTYLRFGFAHRTEGTWWGRSKRRREAHAPIASGPSGLGVTASTPISVPRETFGLAIHARKVLAIAGASFRAIARSWAGVALLLGIPLLTVAVVLDQMGSMGTPLVPTTARVLAELTAPLTAELSRWVILPLLIVFFAGELVWRERDAGLHEIIDAMPGSEWAPFLGKFLGLGLVLVVFTAVLMAAGVLAQEILGHRRFEIGLYLEVLFGLQLPEYLLFAVLAFVVHVVADQKYVGHLVAVLSYVFIAVLASMLGIEHNLLVYGAGPGWSYTEMLGFGSSLGPWLWFKLYWAAWALLLAVVGRLLWGRGKERGLGLRIRMARRRLPRPTAWTAAAAAGLILMLGGFLFYNTNVLNEYRSTSEGKERCAEYERRYRQYENLPQPRMTGTRLRVEIHPAQRAVDIRGSYDLVNGSALPIDSIHVATGVETRALSFDRPSALTMDDEDYGYRVYALERPLEPGDALRLDFEVRVEPHGFGNRGVDSAVTANGSAFTNRSWFPFVGYPRQRELVSAADRRAHGLPPRPEIASLHDVEGHEPAARGGGIAFEAVLGTDEDQVAVAPGALRRTWTEGGRRYFHYSTDAPIGEEWSFYSARYGIHEGRWRDVAIQVFHHPEHTAYLEPLLRSVRDSLDYYTEQLGPYPYHHLTIVEHPGAPGGSLHAEASIVSHGESFPLWIATDEPGSLDMPNAVVAHEMAHQWTLPYALVEGLPFLSEGLAWYSAIQEVKATRGEEQLQRLLSFLREPHPFAPIRRGEPLLRALDPYLAYRKGPFAMYALSEYVGSEAVNGALRRLIERHDAPGAPLATTLDLHRELKAVTPDSLQVLLHDLFEVNTLWQLEVERATAVATEAGTWQVTLEVQAHKIVYDSAGVESELPMDEWVPIGVFGPADGGPGELSEPLYVEKHRIRSGEQTITVTVPRQPALAGIDPYHLLDWEEDEDDDNIEGVVLGR